MKDKNGKYDFEFLEKIKNKLDELIDEKVLLKEIDKAQEESILMEVLNNIDKDNYSILDGKINSKKINSDDILKNNYEKAIAAENKTAIITITQKDDLENEKIKDFFAFFENELKENNKISQKDKNKILDKYKNSFKNINNNIFFNGESETNLILINKDSEKLKYVTYSYKNDVPVSLIGTESNNIGANISHEIAHFDDAITEEIVPLKHNENEKIYRSKEGGYYYIYSSNNYTINEKFNTITFYPVWEREYNSIFIENEYKKRVSKDLPRVYYGDYDGGMFKTVDFNGNIEKAFEKMIKTRIEEKNEK